MNRELRIMTKKEGGGTFGAYKYPYGSGQDKDKHADDIQRSESEKKNRESNIFLRKNATSPRQESSTKATPIAWSVKVKPDFSSLNEITENNKEHEDDASPTLLKKLRTLKGLSSRPVSDDNGGGVSQQASRRDTNHLGIIQKSSRGGFSDADTFYHPDRKSDTVKKQREEENMDNEYFAVH
jgi:hypothetical protein